MGRWEPNANERLREAAMELFHERGYDRTTVEEIASRAGLTERTFFRYFADKREVLFSGSENLVKMILDAIEGAPATMLPLDAAVVGLEAASAMFDERRVQSRKRQALIVAHADLQERELSKLAALGASIATSLHERRGVARPTASLIGETAMAIFRSAFERWIEDGKNRGFTHHVRTTFAELRHATT